jgi:hypothetical protein
MRWFLAVMAVACIGSSDLSRGDVVEYLRARDSAERAAILAEADAAETAGLPEAERRVQPVELDLPPRRPEVDGAADSARVTPVELDLPPRRPDDDGDPDDGEVRPAAPRRTPDGEPPDTGPADQPPPAQPAAPRQERRRAPTSPAPPPDDGATKPDLSDPKVRACTSHADCGITCAMDCCGAPCGCRGAYNRAYIDAIEKWGRRDCPARIDCPAVGCAYEPAFGAVCRNGRCAPVTSLSDHGGSP